MGKQIRFYQTDSDILAFRDFLKKQNLQIFYNDKNTELFDDISIWGEKSHHETVVADFILPLILQTLRRALFVLSLLCFFSYTIIDIHQISMQKETPLCK